ncbi:helix-turn-helix domain-containing protein [Corynebacterium flavescens]|uniref:helix-turn-helix domain-containing protein n=1 Tax=Corynebacterium flavescens TaxID=28028 RepID=UPI00264878B7|nr:helix-turn-helix transcriptional regulator [Corynebacterium flavescens]MDN6199342.1 helix-turn-helix transcriptional regulator [Corynebacterium flavescens]MDN6654768.1 helix-turn-helix transcriptional regulator [Bifidobacterium crudilactis]
MTTTRWWTYLQGLMGSQTQQEAAEFIGISKSNITRWKAGAKADPVFVVKVARAYGVNVLHALVEAEFITEAEASLREVRDFEAPSKLSNATISSEVERRLRKLDEMEGSGRLATVSSMRPRSASADDQDGTVREWDDTVPHAADGSPDEDALREERGEDFID